MCTISLIVLRRMRPGPDERCSSSTSAGIVFKGSRKRSLYPFAKPPSSGWSLSSLDRQGLVAAKGATWRVHWRDSSRSLRSPAHAR